MASALGLKACVSRVDRDVGLFFRVALMALLCLVPLQIAQSIFILSRNRGRDQRCANRGTASQRESLGLVNCVDFCSRDILPDQTSPQNPETRKSSIGLASGGPRHTSQPTNDCHVVLSLLYRWASMIAPKLQDIKAKHRFA